MIIILLCAMIVMNAWLYIHNHSIVTFIAIIPWCICLFLEMEFIQLKKKGRKCMRPKYEVSYWDWKNQQEITYLKTNSISDAWRGVRDMRREWSEVSLKFIDGVL